ncbi:putative glycoside hydrolase [Lentzea sp. NEAU-D7]|uniref:putative glycoside hydrolase n=1 Tax=Lentzea sp. NEAU-D7 TaxID=2994667 RepID=UPI00224AAEC8|nr:putative glycoside hydrolase [Lentzea sp. NEAU-D7]MCX2954545.1 putative glycoside hydrolase [Lentzea sp. NEAU-D7]
MRSDTTSIGGAMDSGPVPSSYERGHESRLASIRDLPLLNDAFSTVNQLGSRNTSSAQATTAAPAEPAPAQPPAPTASTPAATARSQSAPSTQSFWLHLNSTPVPDGQLEAEARRHAYIVLNAWESSMIAKIKAASPGVQVFVYKDLSSTRSYACSNGTDDAQLPTGVGYCDTERKHPEWFLTTATGQRLQYSGYSGHWQMDVGNTGYQNAWIANVISSTTAAGFDGVLLDNALFSCDSYHDGVCPARYPDDSSFQNAYTTMLANVGSRLSAAGLTTVANLSNARLFTGAWTTYMEHLDGGFDEWWLAFSDTNLLPEYDQGWSRQLKEVSANEARGKITWVQPHLTGGVPRPFRYALASYLMVSGPRSAFAPIAETDGYGDPSPDRAEYGWTLGSPRAAYRPVGNNLFRRDFECGAVLVNSNPTGAAATTIPLGDAYTDESGRSVSSVSLPGTSGAVLRRNC